MKVLFSFIIIILITKECNKRCDSESTNSTVNIEETTEASPYSQENNVTQMKHPSETYYIEFLKDRNVLPLNLTVIFDENSKRVSGFSSCNQFSGTYIIKENSITFSKLISTHMYCDETQEIENLMIKCLSNTNSFSIDENQLILKNGETELLVAQKESKENIRDNIIIEYSAISRGFYNYVVITSGTILVQKDRNSEPISKICSKEEWAKLMEQFKTIDSENLSKLDAPTKAHQYDGAAIAQLKIIVDNVTYETVSFDHGTPPKEIEALVKEILSISENIE